MSFPRLRSTVLSGLATLALACSPEPAPTPRRPAAPTGAAAYREILRNEAHLDWTPDQLARVARTEARFVRARMDRLAVRLGQRDGLAAYAELSLDHPATAQEVLAAYRQAAERARLFVEERGLVTIFPGRPLQVVETPTVLTTGRYPFVAYLGDKLAVTIGTGPSALGQHCRACVAPLVAHEGYPGHHVAFLVRRRPRAEPGTQLLALANAHAKNRFHGEGWAQYAEVLMLEAGFYATDPAGELAAWRLILLRLHRAALDADLHAGRIDGPQLVRTLIDEAGVLPEIAAAELAHHLEEPGMKASYLVGLLQILALREQLELQRSDSGPGFDRRAFHDQLLAWPLPWPEVARRFFGLDPLVVPDDGRCLVRVFGDSAAMIAVP